MKEVWLQCLTVLIKGGVVSVFILLKEVWPQFLSPNKGGAVPQPVCLLEGGVASHNKGLAVTVKEVWPMW